MYSWIMMLNIESVVRTESIPMVTFVVTFDFGNGEISERP